MAVANRVFASAALAALLAVVSACDNGPSAVATNDRSDASRAPASKPDDGNTERAAADIDATPQVDGKPMWSSTQRYTAQENAQRAFERNGEAFGAKDLDDFVRKAHAFAQDPPAGAETITRANGDKLIYDAKSNVFMVVTRQGAPRTMFKPDDGKTYWAEQQTREQDRQNARRSPGKAEEDRG